jgi:hypothetical protein
VTLNYSSWEEARLMERVVEIFAQPDLEVPDSLPLAESAALRRSFLDGYQQLREEQPEAVERVYRRVRQYDRLLRVFALRHNQVASRYPRALVALYVLRVIRTLLLRLPLVIIGVALNYVPYRLPGRIAARAADDPDEEATYKVFGGLFLFPLFWAAEITLTGLWLGTTGAVLMAILAPVSGAVALLARDERDLFREEVRAYLVLKTRSHIAEELRGRRAEIYQLVNGLVHRLESAEAQARSGAS